ncbi:hypothetical protein C8034_v007113 [Colletotrichum sidae]|uniref:Heterokaryon incompatibility domain-containing protein n=1 Tax=Colletotrichum sidae TaxID=1347389 RepID=A0A4R8T3U8_9PEZI|nr:hypothetical protein C8034_v007113 [Colletotrichum sidae]
MADEPCHCRVLHLDCDSSRCKQAKHTIYHHAPLTSLRELRKSATNGCSTCGAIVNAVLIPEVRDAWRGLIAPALASERSGVVAALAEDEEAIEIEFDPPRTVNGRRVLRLRASHDSEDWHNFNLWRESADETCKAFSSLAYHPSARTDSRESLGHLKSWIKGCDRSHSCFDEEQSELPTRVVQVSGNEVKVVHKSGHRARYTTLSHRWGEDDNFKLTRSNLEGPMTQGLPWEAIPKTFQDAIWLTRQLRIDYIWIDSLCIIQDDADDWRAESVQMGSVYGHSYLNIAASHNTGSDDGLFMASDVGELYPAHPVPGHPRIFIRQQPYRTHDDFGSSYSRFKWPLLTRGWVLQERLLSPRVAYFDSEEMKWECMQAADCQCGAIVSMWNFKIDYSASVIRGQTPLPFEWMRIAEVYSKLSLTDPGDRVVALSGIAKQASASGRGGRYLAGVWQEDLAHQLCWAIWDSTFRKPEKYIAPSWSWLSVFGSVGIPNRMDYTKESHIDVVITDAECTPADGTDDTGPIMSGYLKFNGRCVKMGAELSSWDAGAPPVFNFFNEVTRDLLASLVVNIDYVMAEEEARKVTNVVFVYWGDMWPHGKTFLVLKPIPDQGRTYERIGIFWEEENCGTDSFEKLLRVAD